MFSLGYFQWDRTGLDVGLSNPNIFHISHKQRSWDGAGGGVERVATRIALLTVMNGVAGRSSPSDRLLLCGERTGPIVLNPTTG